LKLTVIAPCVLLEALGRMVPGASNRTLRQILSTGRVLVNGSPCKKGAWPLSSGDQVHITSRRAAPAGLGGIEIVHEDDDLFVILKPAGLLTVSTEHETRRTALAVLRQQVQQQDKRGRIFVVHRLDKFVSGLLVFARSEPIREGLRAQFMKHDIVRKYWAAVEGTVRQSRGTIESYLAENKSLRMRSVTDSSQGKRAVTHYRVLERRRDVTILEITLETGRKNQIRVHLSEMGHPIVGDRAYGSRTDPLKRIALHAFCLGFTHPRTRRPILFESDPPAELARYFSGLAPVGSHTV